MKKNHETQFSANQIFKDETKKKKNQPRERIPKKKE